MGSISLNQSNRATVYFMQRIVRLGSNPPIKGEALQCMKSKLGNRLITWTMVGPPEGPEEGYQAALDVDSTSDDEADGRAAAIVREAGEACGLALSPEIAH